MRISLIWANIKVGAEERQPFRCDAIDCFYAVSFHTYWDYLD
jgi:hypothetical protein